MGLSTVGMATAVVRGMTDGDADQVIALWHLAGVARSWNDPVRDISFARRGEHSTVLVAELHGRVVATAMVGEDGHRGWVYYVASDPERRGVGLGRFVMEASERWLAARGIWKVQLLVRADNAAAQAFYEHLGYADTGSTCFQKMLPHAQVVVEGEKFFGKDRVDLAAEAYRQQGNAAARLAATPREVIIREASDADTDFLFSLAPRLAGVPRPPWQTTDAMTGFQDRFMQATLRPPQEESLTLVAIGGDGRRLGYVHAHASRDGVTDEPCGHVAIIALEADAEGQGVAGRLMAGAEAWGRAQNWRLLSIDVFAANCHALDFYVRGGFHPETVRLVKPL